MNKPVEPSVKRDAFNCPTCDAYAAQDWHLVATDGRNQLIEIASPETVDRIRRNAAVSANLKPALMAFQEQLMRGRPVLKREPDFPVMMELHNVFVSRCHRCDQIAIWVYDKLIYPSKQAAVVPNADLDPEIQDDFNEARQIVHLSPRGAAALLRLALQKLCAQLGEPNKKIDTAIANLVARGLDPTLQKALDSVRVIGNEAVHPGELDLRDDKETALLLFDLLNLIAEQMLTRPKAVQGLYDRIPQAKRDGIDARDAAALKAATESKGS
ncbi:DUF4145 domain-containing protein [Dyella sp. 2RAB6]|uniref:DUF4145 domain-containing protein n=1 Tax=Dyella sp. 2RAB6 TaxID=3232992 RepID=UPI003F9170C7